jgi:hypothetical protein
LRLPRLLLFVLAAAALAVLVRRRRRTEFVDVEFEDGSSIRFERGMEASDLVDDAYQILGTAG